MDNNINLAKVFINNFDKYSDKIALTTGERSISYTELKTESLKIANSLKYMNIKPNDKVALLLSNSIEYSIIDLAIIFSNATRVAMNTMLNEKEIFYILKNSESKIIFIDEKFIKNLVNIKDKLDKLENIIVLDSKCKRGNIPNSFICWEDFRNLSSNCLDNNIHIENINGNQLAFIAYTGGTTGYPKGAMYSKNKLFLILLAHIIELQIKKEDKILLTSPFPHSAGMILLTGLLRGATICIENKFNTKKVIKLINEKEITFLFMVPTMIYRILDEIEGQNVSFSSLKTILYGAAPITTERLKKAINVFGPVFTQLYGQTESYNFITRLTKEDHLLGMSKTELLASCGQPVLLSQIKIVDEDGNELPNNKAGEVIVNSPYNMDGYHNDPVKTKETLQNGWLYTGDIGYIDEKGYLYLMDRKNDLIISGGLNIYTTEVEQVIQKHSDVSQVAVIGKPDSEWGEAVTAIIVPKKGKTLNEEGILNLCRNELSRYKIPKYIEFTDSLPVTPYGKIDKKLLRIKYS